MPALNLEAFRRQVQAGALAPLYVLTGDDVKLVDRMVDSIEETIDPADRPFAVDRLYAAEAGGAPVDIAAAARVFPMLGDRRLVIVLRAERILKPRRATKGADAVEAGAEQAEEEVGIDFTPLEDYLASPVPSTTLVFVATEIDRSRRFTKRLVEKAQVVTFSGLSADNPADRREARAAAIDLVKTEVTQAGRTIDPAAVNIVVNRAGGDVTKLRGDLERLLLYTEGQARIMGDDAAEVAAPPGSIEDPWGLVNAIADGDAPRALGEAGRRIDLGDSPHMLLGQLRWWVSNRLVEGDPDRVRPALDALLRTDLALKSSGGDERVLIERVVVELTGRPVVRRLGR